MISGLGLFALDTPTPQLLPSGTGTLLLSCHVPCTRSCRPQCSVVVVVLGVVGVDVLGVTVLYRLACCCWWDDWISK